MSIHADTDKNGPIKIDIGAVLRSRLGAQGRRVPGFVVRLLERLICQRQLNDMLSRAWPRRGADFCRAVLAHLDVHVDVRGADNLPPDASRALFVCNHPLGGLDGLALIALVQQWTGRQPLFVVNDLLMAVEPLREVFLPVNKHGRQSRTATMAIDAAMPGDRPIIIFPAGLCSRLQGGKVADLPWQKMFVQKARAFGRDIVPLHFAGHNSRRFYRTALWRSRLGIKFNIEMALLPAELVRAAHSRYTVTVGEPVKADTLSADPCAEAARLQRLCYDLSK